MNRYDPELFAALKREIKEPFNNIKPLKLDLTQFYIFMIQRCLNKVIPKIPRGNSKIQALLDILETEADNSLSIHMYSDIVYLPDGNVTWSIRKYESN